MNIILKLPKEFEEHYNKDRFKDALERINVDVRSLKFEGLSGQYELETLEMLITALKTAVPAGKLYLNSMYGMYGQCSIYADIDHGFMNEGSDTKQYKAMTTKQLEKIRNWLIDNIMKNSDIMLLSDEIRNGKIDLVEVIASLYEVLHREVTGETYNYMFHHANKIGAWINTDSIFTDMIENVKEGETMKLDEIKKTLAEVQKMCKATTRCAEVCPFYINGSRFTNCGLNEWPENWLLDKIKEKKGENNDE